MRYCRPSLTTVFTTMQGAHCIGCSALIGGCLHFMGDYGILFISGPRTDFADVHEYYGPIHLFPGDENAVQTRIATYGWAFPHLIESYSGVTPVQEAANSAAASRDSLSMFLNRDVPAVVHPLPEVGVIEGLLRDCEHENPQLFDNVSIQEPLGLGVGAQFIDVEEPPSSVVMEGVYENENAVLRDM